MEITLKHNFYCVPVNHFNKMNFFDKLTKISGNILHDRFGNIFVECGGNYYYLSIDNKDELEFINVDIKCLYVQEHDYEYSSIIKRDVGDSKKSKNRKQLELMYPEEKTFKWDKSQYDEYEWNGDVFNFCRSDTNEIVKQITNGYDENSIYDTLVMDHSNNVIFVSENPQRSPYQIIIHLCGTIELRLIGNKTKSYSIIFDIDKKILCLTSNR